VSGGLRLATALLALVPGTSGCARAVEREAAADAPDAARVPTGDERADGPSATLSFPGRGPVTVRPLRVEGERRAKCLVELIAPGGATQRLITIGEGETETLGCTGINAFGAVPAPPGTARIAILYDAFSPNAEVLAPVVLEAEASGAWRVNDELAQRLSEGGRLDSIAAVRRALTNARK
jgi:hypothetical protein